MWGTRRAAGIMALVCLVVAAALPCQASFIRLRVLPQAEITERFLTVSLDLRNEGDEPALLVRATVQAANREITVPVVNRLAVGEQVKMPIRMPVGLLEPGSYSAVVRINYSDEKGYPLSTITVAGFSKWDAVPTPVVATIQAADLSSSTSVLVRLSNVDRRPHRVRLRLIAPRELSVDPALVPVSLPAGGRESLRFTLSSESALPGSTYLVSAIAESETDGHHTSTVASTTVRIQAPAWSHREGRILVVILAALPLAVVALIRLVRLRPGARASRKGSPAIRRSSM